MTQLLNKYLTRFTVRPTFTEEEVEHYFIPVEDVIDTYVVEGQGKRQFFLTALPLDTI